MKKEDGPQLGTGLVGRRRRASNVHNHSDETVQLDDELVCILMEIERIYVDFPKPLQIRIEKWVEKISEPILHLQWKKNANNYAILLLHMARRGVFRAPFDKAPPLGPLQTLPRHMICSLDGLQKPPRKPPPHPRNAWLKAYERVVHRTRPTSTESSDFAAVTTPPAPVPQGRDPRRPLSYVEIVNETINNLEAELAAERSTNVSLHEQLEELTRLCKSQAASILESKAELQEANARHSREIERLHTLHAMELDDLKKKHQRQVPVCAHPTSYVRRFPSTM
ncbi:hypothetical protein, variant 2 [Aphanomyces invadans]|uniref:DUF4485 domain-containing protein n=1 Tax=Aphanomyces invadans TaxID=157072 RepID=A0A024TMB8_9STRA|nr:hypothetical protein, variant 2 [Aphanomyces invadans]ETV94462.1 hypothetical protein, variant 2 [Aphanomyces invadans]|eukprot:XP_008876775.1 hypothetical protein, variant 2 [Aphanomyces invadans]